MAERRLRVAITTRAVHPLHGTGGLERHVFDLVTHLARGDVDVTLITRPPTPGSDASRVQLPATIREVPYTTFPGAGRRWTTILDRDTAYPLFGLRAGRLALELAQSGAIDLVHGLGASVLGYARARGAGRAPCPLVFNPQGLEEFGATAPESAGSKRFAYLPLQRAVVAAARGADRVIATDRSLVQVVARHLGVEAGRTVVIPNAVDLDVCDRLAGPGDGLACRARAGLDANSVLFVTVGRLERSKGYHVLATALGQLAQDEGDWRWAIVGDGPFRESIRRATESAGIASRMIWAGRPDDREVHAWYEAATVFVHPTLYEGSSLVTLEAMAHRRAVVATRAGGLPDKVTPGLTGWLVPPDDPAALADSLRAALAARSRLEGMGAAGRLAVEREFSWPAVTERLLTVYGDLVAAQRK